MADNAILVDPEPSADSDLPTGYLIPAAESTAEIADRGSRFLGICACVESVEGARSYLAEIRVRYADASHHVYAFAVGHGSSVTHGMSDERPGDSVSKNLSQRLYSGVHAQQISPVARACCVCPVTG